MVEKVRLRVDNRSNPIPYTLPVARFGDVAVELSRIVPGYDLRDTHGGSVNWSLLPESDAVFIRLSDLIDYTQAKLHIFSQVNNSNCLHKAPPFGTISEEKRCEYWLRKLMLNTEKSGSKQFYYELSQNTFAIGPTGFNRAWAKADEASGAGWSRPGRRKSQ